VAKPVKSVKWALIAVLGLVPVGASAATYSFNFSTTDPVFTVAGTFTTANTLDAVGGYDVLSMSGTITGPDGGAISLVGNPSQPLFYDDLTWVYDNVLFPNAAPHVDFNGILFSSGTYDYNFYSTGPTTYYLSSNNPAGNFNLGQLVTFGPPLPVAGDAPLNFAASAPEPSTWAMMLLGFIGLGFAGYRRARTDRLAV
jgi:PEP-CTERM motif